ncbi:MAG TPA: IS481 family transposase [Candidatus Limnocylindria bacterium]|nr:IS481 family transposase [Candidatus Limnocylindria bacterium]
MGLGRYVVDAVVLEGRSPTELAKSHGLSRAWVYELVKRFRAGGYAALEPRSRRPKSCPHQHGPTVEAAILALRSSLTAAGHDAGAATIAHHLNGKVAPVPAVSTIWRILSRHGLVRPEPHKRPRSSFIRFAAALPNELWQTDATHWALADGSPVEILNVIDDHSRLLVASVAFATVKAADVVAVFHEAGQRCGYPAGLLSDNAAVFSGSSRKGKVLLESELERLAIACKHSTPYHPQTCGKVERLHQTLKRFLAKQAPAQSLGHLQLQLDTFRPYYNQHRPHRALDGRTPLVAFAARLKAGPAGASAAMHFRVRQDRVDTSGTVTLRYQSRLRHIMVGRAHKHQPVRLLIAGDHVRVIREDGALLRELTIDAGRDYQSLKLSTMS